MSRTLCLYAFYFVPTTANAAYMILCSCIATLQIPLAFDRTPYPLHVQGIVLLTLIVIAGGTPLSPLHIPFQLRYQLFCCTNSSIIG